MNASPDFGSLRDRKRRSEPDVDLFAPGLFGETTVRVLAFDQSLSNTGVVVLNVFGGVPEIVTAFNIKPTTERDGHYGNFDKSRRLYAELESMDVDSDTRVAFETPPSGGKMARPESSILAGDKISLRWPGARMFSAQRGKKLVCGNGNASKTEAHRALGEKCRGWFANYERYITNEAHRDALMVAILCALDAGEETA